MGSGKIVLMRLLQIGAKDLTVYNAVQQLHRETGVEHIGFVHIWPSARPGDTALYCTALHCNAVHCTDNTGLLILPPAIPH